MRLFKFIQLSILTALGLFSAHLQAQKAFNVIIILTFRHGFDEYYGLSYSNDIRPLNPQNPPLPMIENDRMVNPNVTPADRYFDKIIYVFTHKTQKINVC